MKKTIAGISLIILSLTSTAWAWSPWIICGHATLGGESSSDQPLITTAYYSARCPNGHVPDGFTCAYHPFRLVNVAYINNVGGSGDYYNVTQSQMDSINRLCAKVDKTAREEGPEYVPEREGDNGAGLFGTYYDFALLS